MDGCGLKKICFIYRYYHTYLHKFRFVEPSIPYYQLKEHPYMQELFLFTTYVRTGHVRTYAAITPNAPYRVDDQVRTKRT